jgi:hypothetical protein
MLRSSLSGGRRPWKSNDENGGKIDAIVVIAITSIIILVAIHLARQPLSSQTRSGSITPQWIQYEPKSKC